MICVSTHFIVCCGLVVVGGGWCLCWDAAVVLTILDYSAMTIGTGWDTSSLVSYDDMIILPLNHLPRAQKAEKDEAARGSASAAAAAAAAADGGGGGGHRLASLCVLASNRRIINPQIIRIYPFAAVRKQSTATAMDTSDDKKTTAGTGDGDFKSRFVACERIECHTGPLHVVPHRLAIDPHLHTDPKTGVVYRTVYVNESQQVFRYRVPIDVAINDLSPACVVATTKMTVDYSAKLLSGLDRTHNVRHSLNVNLEEMAKTINCSVPNFKSNEVEWLYSTQNNAHHFVRFAEGMLVTSKGTVLFLASTSCGCVCVPLRVLIFSSSVN